MIEERLLQMRRAFRWALAALSAALIALGAFAEDLLGGGLVIVALIAVYVLAFRVTKPMANLISAISHLVTEAETKRDHEARHDMLTGLPNRAHLMEYLNYSLGNAARRDARVGLCLIDLKGLRRLNEARGCPIGDQALRRCAAVVRTETRRGDFVARIGADEFMIVSLLAEEIDELVAIATRLSRSLRRPFGIDGEEIEFGCTAGVVLTEIGETSADRLVNDAAIALRRAKEDGVDCILFEPAMRVDFDAALRLREELAGAIETGQIKPWFQPQIDARTATPTGVEALARWEHPERGVLGPGVFFGVADEFGLMDRIDERILDASLDALIAWRKAGVDMPRVGVNLSARRLRDPYLTERVKWALEERELEPSDLCIEVLESVLIDHPDCEIAQNLNSLSRIGVSIDLDDFGTGHSAIATLKRVKVDRIKIDRSFVTAIDSDEHQQKVAKTMIELAQSFNIKALAEGVETPLEQARLTAMGCDEIQGFGLARPMPEAEIAPWLRHWEKTGSRVMSSDA